MTLRSRMPLEERELPHEPGNFFSFRPLAANQLDEAGAVKVEKSAGLLRSISGIDLPDVKAVGEPAEPAGRPVEADPLAGYDAGLLVRYGLESWRGPNYEGADCSGAAKDEMDKTTRDWAARVIVEISSISLGEGRSSGDGIAANGSEPNRRSVSDGSGWPSASPPSS